VSEEREVRAGDTVIRYTVVRSHKRRKTIQITIDHERGVVVAAPMRVPQREISDLVLRRADWVLQRLGKHPANGQRRQFLSGESVPFLGRDVRLYVVGSAAKRTAVTFRCDALTAVVPAHLGDEERRDAIETALTLWYRARAGEVFAERLQYWAEIAGYAPKAVLVRSQRRRWGSCSSDGTIRLNWRLVMAPPDIIDYVVVHELAHVRVKDHSSGFWAEVARMLPDFKERQRQLHEIGPGLAF
jgi:predicted metal-dependent hydrolase